MNIPEGFNQFFSNIEEQYEVSTDSWKYVKQQKKEVKAKSKNGYKIDGSGIQTVMWVFEKATKNEDKLFMHEVKIYYNEETDTIESSSYYKTTTDNGEKSKLETKHFAI